MEKNDLSLLALAKQAAKAAGVFLSTSTQVDRRIEHEFDHDIKIHADKQSEKIILDILSKASPLAILSEEAGLKGETSDQPFWVVDPIDGTFNFERGMPMCCVSIGLWQHDQPVLGVIYDFNRDEMFSGLAQGGAWCNDKPIAVSQVATTAKGVLYTGFPAGMEMTTLNLNAFVTSVQSYRKARLIGSAALSLAYVACGRGDVYIERNIMLWDIAGGLAILKGAGGAYATESCNKPFSFNVTATNQHLMKASS